MVKPIKGLHGLSFGKVLIHLCLGSVALVFLTPFVYVFLNSFKTTEEIYWVPQSFLPKQWILDNYLQIGEKGHFVDYFMNSVIITCTAVFLVLVISSLAGYAFARLPFKGRQLLLGFILMTITIPLVVFLIPMFLMENAAGLLNTNLGLILPNVAVVLPFAIFIMRSSFVGIPKEIVVNQVVVNGALLDDELSDFLDGKSARVGSYAVLDDAM